MDEMQSVVLHAVLLDDCEAASGIVLKVAVPGMGFPFTNVSAGL